MIFVDTGYLWALTDKRDRLHPRAAAWQSVITERLTTTEYVLLEMVNGFSALEDRAKAHAVLDDIIHFPNDWDIVSASPSLFEAGVLLHRNRADKGWSLTDCISFVIMQEREISRALTHDHHFERAGFEALLRRDPP
jgi:uncharacterized protein